MSNQEELLGVKIATLIPFFPDYWLRNNFLVCCSSYSEAPPGRFYLATPTPAWPPSAWADRPSGRLKEKSSCWRWVQCPGVSDVHSSTRPSPDDGWSRAVSSYIPQHATETGSCCHEQWCHRGNTHAAVTTGTDGRTLHSLSVVSIYVQTPCVFIHPPWRTRSLTIFLGNVCTHTQHRVCTEKMFVVPPVIQEISSQELYLDIKTRHLVMESPDLNVSQINLIWNLSQTHKGCQFVFKVNGNTRIVFRT